MSPAEVDINSPEKTSPQVEVEVKAAMEEEFATPISPITFDNIESPFPPRDQHQDPFLQERRKNQDEEEEGWKKIEGVDAKGNTVDRYLCQIPKCEGLSWSSMSALRRHWDVAHRRMVVKIYCPQKNCSAVTSRPYDMRAHLMGNRHGIPKPEAAALMKKGFPQETRRNNKYLSPGDYSSPTTKFGGKRKERMPEVEAKHPRVLAEIQVVEARPPTVWQVPKSRDTSNAALLLQAGEWRKKSEEA